MIDDAVDLTAVSTDWHRGCGRVVGNANRHDVVEVRVNVGLFGPLQGRRLVWGKRVLNVCECERVVVDGQHLIWASFGGVADSRGCIVRPINEHALSNLQIALERWVFGG